jgi:hypothetical protein
VLFQVVYYVIYLFVFLFGFESQAEDISGLEERIRNKLAGGTGTVPAALLRSVYSRCLTSHWSNVQYILLVWPPVGHVCSIFSFADTLIF